MYILTFSFRSKDTYLKKFPCQITIRYTHNHSIEYSMAFNNTKPSSSMTQTFIDLFQKGFSPVSALDIYKKKLEEKYGGSKHEKLLSYPTKHWCFRLYSKHFPKTQLHPLYLDILRKSIDDYNTQCDQCCALVNINNKAVVVTICTPYMKGIHKKLNWSSEVMFVDSSGNMDRHSVRAYLLLCPSVLGIVPIGVILTNNETEEAFIQGFELLQKILSEDAFYGALKPKVIITNDDSIQRQALKNYFPSSLLFLHKNCFIQKVTKFLWASKNNIKESDKISIYKMCKCLSEIEEVDCFRKKLEDFLKIDVVIKYCDFIYFIKDYTEKPEDWAICYKRKLITNYSKGINFCETTFMILKHFIANRTKLFNIIQLFEYVVYSFENYYITKLMNALSNIIEQRIKTKFNVKNPICKIITEDIYKVSVNDKEYFVNTEVDMCTCPFGRSGAPCRHRYVVEQTFNIPDQYFIPLNDPEEKEIILNILNDGLIIINNCNNIEDIKSDCSNSEDEVEDGSRD